MKFFNSWRATDGPTNTKHVFNSTQSNPDVVQDGPTAPKFNLKLPYSLLVSRIQRSQSNGTRIIFNSVPDSNLIAKMNFTRMTVKTDFRWRDVFYRTLYRNEYESELHARCFAWWFDDPFSTDWHENLMDVAQIFYGILF